jgi:glycosyltransferase involved in cell wall biosynthesis
MDISILLPTRKRPLALSELIESIINTADNVYLIELCIYIDQDDHESVEVVKHYTSRNLIRINYTNSSNPIKLSGMWDYLYKRISIGEIAMLCADDIRFRTKSWDTIIKDKFNEFPDKMVCVYGDDMLQGEGLATHFFIHRKWADASGYFVPPYFAGDFPDLWIDEVASALERKVFLPNVITEHMHVSVGKSEIDVTTESKLKNESMINYKDIYLSKFKEREAQFNIISKILSRTSTYRNQLKKIGRTYMIPDIDKDKKYVEQNMLTGIRLSFINKKL